MARFEEATSKTEAELHAAKRDAAAVREKFRAEAATHRQQVIERTQAEAKKLVGEADTRLQGDVTEARGKIARDAESLAKLAAERILGRPV